MSTPAKIGIKHVAIGMVAFVLVAVVLKSLGETVRVGSAVGVMAAMVVAASVEAYKRGQTDGQDT